MGYLLIKHISYLGDDFTYNSPPLNSGLNIIEGPNRTGKTTFMDLIYYGLGGNVAQFKKNKKGKKRHTEIVNDTNNRVKLTIEINNNQYTLIRNIGFNDVFVSKEDNSEATLFPINRRGNNKVLSDWLLEKLDIKVVDIVQGVKRYKINFVDLLRLIYHNQELNPSEIYKRADNDNVLTDSKDFKKTIFQILIGKLFGEYHEAIAKLKEAEQEKNNAKSLLDEYTQIINKLNIGRDEMNLVHLKKHIQDKEIQLSKLYKVRKYLKQNRPVSSDSIFDKVESLKADLKRVSLEREEFEYDGNTKVAELLKFKEYRENLILEITQIKKIYHTHETLSLFSSDTCPYCLNDIDREEHRCICGHHIDEKEYQRFFYNSTEYMDMLKSKQKSVKTISIAITSLNEEIKEIREKVGTLDNYYSKLKNAIRLQLAQIDAGLDLNRLDEIDDKILEVRLDINKTKQIIEQAEKQFIYQKRFDTAKTKYDKASSKAKELEAKAEGEMIDNISKFNTTYNRLMKNSLKDCNDAKIDISDYMPIINNGEYREASSAVSIRLMYYLTLLSLSLKEEGLNYPRLLLIDTPKTGGIDASQLDKGLKHIEEELKDVGNKKYQVILTTGINTYPPDFDKYVVETLSDNNKLLKRNID